MKLSIVKNVVTLASLLVLTGCFEFGVDEEKTVHTVGWYVTHETERKLVIDECSDNPGETRDDPNCVNAMSAEIQLSAGLPRKLDYSKMKIEVGPKKSKKPNND